MKNLDFPKKVLAIGPELDRCEATMLKMFTDLGVEVMLVGNSNQRYLKDLGDLVKIYECAFKSRFDLQAIIKLRKLINVTRPDIVHIFSARALSNTLLATMFRKTKIIAYRGTIGHLSRLDPSSWFSFLNPKIDKILCVSKAVENYILQQGVPAQKVTTIYKGHKIEWYETSNNLKRSDFNIPKESIVIGCVANVRPVKGVDYLIKAFSKFNETKEFDKKNLFLLLIGDLGSNYIVNLIKNSPLSTQIITTGFRKDATDIIALSDIFVMPSVAREGLPKALIEAMAKGIAPIVTRVGGMPEVVADQIHGLVVEPKDESQLHQALLKLVLSASLRQVFGQKSKERIKNYFNIDNTVKQTLEVYRSLNFENR